MSSLPNSWICAALANIAAKITKGTTPTTNGFRFQSAGVNFIKVENLRDGKIALDSIEQFISEEAHQAQMRSALQEGDVLFSIAGTIGEIAIVEEKHLPANTNQALAVISGAGDALEPKFLEFQLKSLGSRDVIARARGGAMNNISLGDLREMRIVVAPRNEQRRIVAKIEELFSELDKGVESLTTAREQLNAYRQSVLKAAFEGKLNADWRSEQPGGLSRRWTENYSAIAAEEAGDLPKLPEGWAYVRLGDFIAGIEAGKSFRCDERVPNDDEIGVAKVSAVTWGEYDEDESKTCIDADKINSGYLIREGDFLFSRANTIELVGACVIAKRVTRDVMLSDKTLRITFDRIDPRYVLHYLRSRLGRKEIMRRSTGNQESMRNIGQERIKSIILPLCPPDEAEWIVNRIQDVLSSVDKVESEIETELQRAAALRQSILKRAFSGQLVAQDPADEPATELLERIRAERLGSGETKRRTNKNGKKEAA